MAIGILKANSVIGIAEEGTEGIYTAPPDALSFIQPLEDGFEMSPAKELVERGILDGSIGQATPRVGTKSVTGTLPVEFRASGLEGGVPDFDLLLQSCLGNRRQIAARVTTKAGNGTSQLEIQDADIANFTKGDSIVILEAGDYSIHVITAVDPSAGTANITYLPARSVAPADNVEISKTTVYYPANSGHKPLSLSYYWGNEIRQSAIGCKIASLSIDSFQTGQVASFNFGFEGLTFDEVDGVAPFTPTYDSGLPPLILEACVFQDGVQIDLNEFTLSLENTLSFLTSTCSQNGRIKSRINSRSITGSINPYKDDTSVDQHTKFNANTPYSLFIRAYNPDDTNVVSLGSVVTLWLPNCISVEKTVGDQDGTLIDNIAFQATRGDDGQSDEFFIGMI